VNAGYLAAEGRRTQNQGKILQTMWRQTRDFARRETNARRVRINDFPAGHAGIIGSHFIVIKISFPSCLSLDVKLPAKARVHGNFFFFLCH
jgi:hypothetical protein